MNRAVPMRRRFRGGGLIACVGVMAVIIGGSPRLLAAQTPRAARNGQVAGLRIVVLEGEGAVNIIQQKTAVAPVVEVRDRNDQPVAGAIVRFAVQNGRASFNGARTLTVTTNVAGRAGVSGLTPTSSGAFQITASVTSQGQTAVATIAQTNVLTAAQAVAAAGTGGLGAASGAGAAAAGSGGGLSATTLGIVGGAVAGGALVAVKTLGRDATSGSGGASDVVKAAAGTYQLQLVRGSALPVLLFGQCSIGGPPPCAPCTESATSGTLTLGASPQKYAINLIASGPCVDPLGGSPTTLNSYISGAEGNWADTGGATISFTSNALGLSSATISNSTVTASFNWLHPSAGGTPVTAVFGK